MILQALSGALALTIAATPADAEQRSWNGRSVDEVENAARHEDKTAAFELGRRYETGQDGVPCDIAKAKKWYTRAAQTTSGTTPSYSAPVGSERFGRLVEVGGRIVPGLPIAAARLDALQAIPRSQNPSCLAARSADSLSRPGTGGQSATALADAFLKYSMSQPSPAGLRALFTPDKAGDDSSPAMWATPRAGLIGKFHGMFAYSQVDCLVGGQRVRLAAPHELCAAARAVVRYSFHLDEAQACLEGEVAIAFLQARGWRDVRQQTAETPPSSMTYSVPLRAEFSHPGGGYLELLPVVRDACVADFYFYRGLQ